MVANLITQADIELRIGSRRLGELASMDASGVADAARVAQAIALASARAAGKLLAAFTNEQVEQLAAADQGVKAAVVSIALGYLGEGRPEFLDAQGRTLYAGTRADGLAQLGDYVKGADRIAAEETVGRNGTLGTRVTRQRPPVFIFAATKRDPKGPGGF